MSQLVISQTTALAKALKIDAAAGELVEVMKATAFRGQVSDAQMAALLVVANHVRINESSGCWEWEGAKSRGYGQVTFQGRHMTAHRFAFSQLSGPIDDGAWVLHHCDNRACVNPAHLYQGTAVDNRRDMLERKRWTHSYGMRTSCGAGHDYGTVGFRVSKDGSRVCRECQKLYKRAQRAALKEKVA